MKKLLLLLLTVSSLAFGQEEVPYDALGAWFSTDGEVLVISREENKVIDNFLNEILEKFPKELLSDIGYIKKEDALNALLFA